MKTIRWIFMVTLLAVGLVSASETLDNNVVIEMHKLGFGEQVILEKIKTSPGKYDASMSALKALKESGLADSVIAAVISASSTREAAVAAGDPNDPTAPHDAGIWLYMVEGGQPTMAKIEPSAFGAIKSGGGFGAAYGVTSKARAVMAGTHARTQVSQSRPVFYLYFEKTQSGLSNQSGSATTPEDFTLLKMEVKADKKERRIVIGKANVFGGARSGFEEKALVEIEYEKVSNGVYKISSKHDLDNGEYCFVYTGASTFVGIGFAAGGPSKGFCFGIGKNAPQP